MLESGFPSRPDSVRSAPGVGENARGTGGKSQDAVRTSSEKSQDPNEHRGRSRVRVRSVRAERLTRRVLSRNGELVALQPKAFDMLLRLVERRDVVLTKDELLRELWPGTFVDEANLSQNTFVLRKALGQEGGDGYIKTVPKRGYRFVADVREAGGAADPAGPTADIERPTPSPSARLTPRKRRQTPGFAIAGLLLCACATFGYVRLGRERAKAPASPRSLAVLPFNHLGPRLGDDTRRRVVRRPDHPVEQSRAADRAAHQCGAQIRGAGTDTVAAGRELRTDAVLEGSLQRDGDRLRVTVRLINVVDGAPIGPGPLTSGSTTCSKCRMRLRGMSCGRSPSGSDRAIASCSPGMTPGTLTPTSCI